MSPHFSQKKNRFFPARIVGSLVFIVARLRYRVSVRGGEEIPERGGVLLICNHLSTLDALLLQLASPRKIRFLAPESLFRSWWLGGLLRSMGVISISPQDSRQAIRQAVECLQKGEVVGVFPEKKASRTGNLQRMRPGFRLIAEQAGCPVQPVVIDGMWGSRFSAVGREALGEGAPGCRRDIRVRFGKPWIESQGFMERARLSLLDLSAEAFLDRPALQGNVAHRTICRLAAKPWKRQLVDTFPARRELSRGKLLGVSLAYSRVLKKRVLENRVGVVLPPGAGGTIANLAAVFAGKIPVNINFTAGRAATEASYRSAEIKRVISAEAMEAKLPNFSWPEERIDLPSELKKLSKYRMLGWVALAYLLPGKMLAAMVGVPKVGGAVEAGLLFTSGSAGEPKGVVLTHENILGNIEQIIGVNLLRTSDSFLASLPLFHSFGFTITLWLPILCGIPVVTVPSPLDPRKIAEAASQEKITALFGTPTFLRPYLRKIKREELASVRVVVTGAEKLPPDLREEFQEKFGIDILEGYGLTETSPVVSVNLPDPCAKKFERRQAGGSLHSVGRLMPGTTARIADEEVGELRSSFEKGMLLLKGINIFNGYLHDEEQNQKAFLEGWFITGDIARFDEDGFLYIEGRLSRFSKVGGEMVPHGTVEERIREVMNLESDEPRVVVTGISEEGREQVIALVTVPIDLRELRSRWQTAGLPNLWIPRQVFLVECIPILGTGKLNLQECRRLAERCVAGAAGTKET